ncbi:MAG: hypothetical protein E7364_01935 [Clostridiales bacterium]|nr:hypothetical protein [Clostridiales bacterium]
MEIDIISYTDEQYAVLTTEQIVEVRKAQVKKNKLGKKLEASLLDAEKRHIENGTYHSTPYQKTVEKLQAEYEQEVENVREDLLFYLRYTSRPNPNVPYTLNYALTYPERELLVRDYYLTTYSNATERFEAFKADEVALQYLGERYASLYDYFSALKNMETGES